MSSYLIPLIFSVPQSGSAAEEYPYFKWIPDWITDVKPDGGPVFWSAPCFTNNSATLTSNPDGVSWKLEITTSTPVSEREWDMGHACILGEHQCLCMNVIHFLSHMFFL